MKPYQVNIINAIILLVMGLWSYFHPETPRSLALIPVAFGLLFLATTPLFRSGNRIIAYLIGGLTLLLLLALAGSLIEALVKREIGGIIRFGIMVLSNAIATIFYIVALKKTNSTF